MAKRAAAMQVLVAHPSLRGPTTAPTPLTLDSSLDRLCPTIGSASAWEVEELPMMAIS
jgi:hypothetical protein